MKKIIYLALFCCLSVAGFGQTTVTLYATGAAASYTCGHDNSGTTRVDGSPTFRATASAIRGYAVFDLSTIPAGAIIQSVTLGYNVTATSGAAGTCNTYGYAGDLSTVTAVGTLYTDMVGGTLINTTYYGTTLGNQTLATNTATQTFVSGHIGTKVSICFTISGGTRAYTYTGETGTAATTGAHAPYLQITYCHGVTGENAVATPNPVCPGSTLTLTGTAGGATGYHWVGPAGFTGTTRIDSVVGVTTTAAGVYTFIATDSTGCQDTVTTANVSVKPSPAAISGVVTPLCQNIVDSVWDSVGSWSISPVTVATISPTTGTAFTKIHPVGGGVATVTYTDGTTGCQVSTPLTINPAPPAIAGPDFVCLGFTTTLNDTIPGVAGTWSSAFGGIATVNPIGVVTPISVGITIISFTNPTTGCAALETFTVGQMPSYITGIGHLCVASIDTFIDSVSGGIWTSTNPYIATVNDSTGIVTGYNAGFDTVVYTLPSGCNRSYSFLITSAPGPILNAHGLCPGDSVLLADTIAYGAWSDANPGVATLSARDTAHAMIQAVSAGTAYITYSSCGYNILDSVVVNPNPSPITGRDSVCIGDNVTLFDSTDFGIWISTDTSLASAAAAFGIITGKKYGVDSVTYMLPTGCYTKHVMYVDSLPAQITGNLAVCVNATTTLNDGVFGGTWFTKHRATDTLVPPTSGVIRGVSPGIDTVIYKAPTGCRITAQLTVNAIPVPITGDSVVCSLDSTMLFDGTPGGYWTSGNTSAFTIDSFVPNLVMVDTNKDSGYVYYTLPATGCRVSYFIHKRGSPQPFINFVPGLGEDTCQLGFTSYQWYDSTGGDAIPGATTNYVAIRYNHVYYVVVTDTFGCVGRSVSFYSTSAGVPGVNNADRVVVYPNPAQTTLHILSAEKLNAAITTVDGRILLEAKQASTIDVSKLAPGTYMITLFGTDGTLYQSSSWIKE
jgi:Secretion system C-terminal sorting domain